MKGLGKNANPPRWRLRAVLLAPSALLLAACANDKITATNTLKSTFDKPDWAVSAWDSAGAKRAKREVKPEELVDANGLCAGMAPPQPAVPISQSFTSEGPPIAPAPNAAPGPSAPEGGGLSALGGGIALEMTECEVVRRAGFPDRVELSANERSERAVTLTFMRGERPGIYRFVSGRLVSIERGPAPPPEPKPVKPAKKPVKRAKQAPPSNAVETAPLRPPTKITVGR